MAPQRLETAWVFTVVFYSGAVKAKATVKTWEKTRLQNLVRHKSGRYYAHLFLSGKEIWKSIETSHFSLAEAKLAVPQQAHAIRRAREVDSVNVKTAF